MSTAILDAILDLLTREGVTFDHVHHEPTRTTADAARVRGVPMDIGGKSLLLKVDDDFRLFVLSGARRLDSSALRRTMGTSRTRFATPQELLEQTGLVPGGVPPLAGVSVWTSKPGAPSSSGPEAVSVPGGPSPSGPGTPPSSGPPPGAQPSSRIPSQLLSMPS